MILLFSILLYKCKCQWLTIKVGPKVEASTQVNEQSCVVGQDTQMTWKFSGIEKPRVIWYFNDQPLETNDRFQVTERDDGRSTLTIRKTQLVDGGVYTARASNSVGIAEAQTALSIVGIQPVILTDLEAQLQVTKGQTITLKLNVSGTPKPKIVWMRGNDALVSDKRFCVTLPTSDSDGIHTLTILNVQLVDQGEYSAKIENIAGSFKSQNCQVTVIGKADVDPFFDQILKKQAASKAYYDSFPDIDDVTNETSLSMRKVEEFTKLILNIQPSGNVAERDTVCHVLSRLLGDQGQQCLFYDSANGINMHDASGNLADLASQDRPFVLKLKNSAGLGYDSSPKTDEDDVKLAEIINDAIKNNESHPVIDDIRDRLAKAHGVDKQYIVIIIAYAGTFNIVYTVLHLASTAVTHLRALSTRLRTQFAQFVSAKIHPLLYRPSFDISLFDARGNKTFSSRLETHQIGPPGRTKSYTTAAGWTRYGLKVLGKYGNDDWLHPFGHAGNWYRAFHGTGNAQNVDFGSSNAYSDQSAACVDAISSIFRGGFRPARSVGYGPGVYCSPNPKFPENGYVRIVSLNTTLGPKKFICMLQVAVNPDGVNCATNDIWVARTPQDIRPYGILIKEA